MKNSIEKQSVLKILNEWIEENGLQRYFSGFYLFGSLINRNGTLFIPSGSLASDVDVIEISAEQRLLSKATKCKQFMFSLSLSPPKDHIASEQDFLDAADRAEKTLGLDGQAAIQHSSVSSSRNALFG